jgi:NDP-sugar pyrophosphorylase family protein
MIRAGAKLGGIVLDEGAWWDLGSRSEYLAVHTALARRAAEDVPWISPYAGISSDARIYGATMIAPGAEVGSRVTLHDCIVWQNATVSAGAHLTRCIVADGAIACGEHADVDFAE